MSREFDDSLDDLIGGEPRVRVELPIYTPASGRLFTEPCSKCRGSGQFRSYSRVVGACFTCKGTGQQTFKTASEVRARARASSAARKQEARDTFAREHEAEIAWIYETAERQIIRLQQGKPQWEFPISLQNSLVQYGSLTDGQLAAVRKAMVRDEERKAQWKAERANRPAPPAIDPSKLLAAFAKRRAAKHDNAEGVAFLALQFGSLRVTPDRKSPADVWFKNGDTWIGKTENGTFKAFRACTDTDTAQIMAICDDPGAAARASGLDYRFCSCCGLPLTSPESIARGIGPICAEKWGF